jgi:PAS domain-containing protein
MNSPGVSLLNPSLVSLPIEISPDRLTLGPLREMSEAVQTVVQFERYISAPVPEKYGVTDPAKQSAPPVSELSSVESAENLRLEQVAHAIARANVEQGQRSADCMRDCMESLLRSLDQPCAIIDRNGAVTQWNDALSAFTKIEGDHALGKTLPALFGLDALHPLAHALRLRNSAATYMPENWSAHTLAGPILLFAGAQAAQVTLIPRYYIPGCLESIIILVTYW